MDKQLRSLIVIGIGAFLVFVFGAQIFKSVPAGHVGVATLFGNVTQWNVDYLGRQAPVLPASGDGLVKKVKPLIRVAERETAAYCVLRGIEYEVEECPMAKGNTITHIVEGETVLTYTDPQLDPGDGDAKRLLAAGQPKMLTGGTISIQGESHPCEFRKIEILELPD